MAQQARRCRVGPLEAVRIDGTPDGYTVILFHGFGANMLDLAPLAAPLQAPKGTNWIFPNGHIEVPLGPHTEGRAWFPLRLAELEEKMAVGETLDLTELNPPGLKRARENALAMIDTLKVDVSRLIIGGFSQGAMLATDVAMHLEQAPAGLAILSGTLIGAQGWRTLGVKHKALEFFQSHGRHDQILAFANAKKLEDFLKTFGWVGALLAFDGAHEIPPEVVIQLGAYIRRCCTRQPNKAADRS